VLRLLAHVGIAAIGATFAVLIGVQYTRIIGRNIAYVQQIHQVEADVAALERRRDEQRRTIARLSDPQGAIPEIHDRLHLVRDHEAIIYLKRHDAPPERP
jgi:cell division protein FtsB